MSNFSIELEIKASQDKVFDFISDAEKANEWYDAVIDTKKITSGKSEKNTMYLFKRKLPQGIASNEVKITEFNKPEIITFKSVSGPTPFTYRYIVTATDYGSLVVLDGHISAKGLGGPVTLLSPFASKFFANGMRKNLNNLRDILEK